VAVVYSGEQGGKGMISASGSFEDFMVEFKKRHPKDYVGELSTCNHAVNNSQNVVVNDRILTMPKIVEKSAHSPVSVRLDAVSDRMSKAAGDDFDDWDGVETEDYTEGV
jgi:hypothetical protein